MKKLLIIFILYPILSYCQIECAICTLDMRDAGISSTYGTDGNLTKYICPNGHVSLVKETQQSSSYSDKLLYELEARQYGLNNSNESSNYDLNNSYESSNSVSIYEYNAQIRKYKKLLAKYKKLKTSYDKLLKKTNPYSKKKYNSSNQNQSVGYVPTGKNQTIGYVPTGKKAVAVTNFYLANSEGEDMDFIVTKGQVIYVLNCNSSLCKIKASGIEGYTTKNAFTYE